MHTPKSKLAHMWEGRKGKTSEKEKCGNNWPENSVFCLRSSSTSGFSLLFCFPMTRVFCYGTRTPRHHYTTITSSSACVLCVRVVFVPASFFCRPAASYQHLDFFGRRLVPLLVHASLRQRLGGTIYCSVSSLLFASLQTNRDAGTNVKRAWKTASVRKNAWN